MAPNLDATGVSLSDLRLELYLNFLPLSGVCVEDADVAEVFGVVAAEAVVKSAKQHQVPFHHHHPVTCRRQAN